MKSLVGLRFVLLTILLSTLAVLTGCNSVGAKTPPSPPTVNISVSPTSITAGDSATLTWSSSNATAVTITPPVGTGNLPASGSATVNPTQTTTYQITAAGPGGSASASATLTVNAAGGGAAPTVTISVNPTTINSGQSATLVWSSTNATSVTISPSIGSGTTPTSGSATVNPTQTTTYTITATGAAGTTPATATTTLTVNAIVGPPTVTISVSPTNINSGQSATLTWNSTNATSVTITPPVVTGVPPLSGTATVNPTQTTTYTIKASGGTGTTPATATTTLTVNPGPPPTATISVDPTTITAGQSATLKWDSTNATEVHITPPVAADPLPLSDTIAVSPTQDTTYQMTVKGPGGTTTASTFLKVNPNLAPTLTFQADKSSVTSGDTVTLQWQMTNANSIAITATVGSGSPTPVTTSSSARGTYQVSPTQTTTYTGTATGPGGTASQSVTVTVTASNSSGIQKVNHIIFVAQENRSFDSYFGKLNEYRARFGLGPDVDGLPDDCSSSNSDWTVPCSAMNKAPDASGYPTTPTYAFNLKNACIENTSADWIVSHWDFNALDPASDTPKMDGFAISAASAAHADCPSSGPCTSNNNYPDLKGIRAMGFYTGDDLPYHYWLATKFATSDRWFSPLPSRTQANRYYMVGATSGGHAYESTTAIQAPTIFDRLDAAHVSWKIYVSQKWTSASVFAGFLSRFSSHVVPLADFYSDAHNGQLPAVAYIEKPDSDEHPGTGVNIQTGVNETKQLVNAVMYGPSWSDSVFILTFDESGGLYDHVPPPTNVPNPDGIKPVDICTSSSDSRCSLAAHTHTAPPYDPDGDFTRYGFRVPLMVVSPFTKPGYVSHRVTDFTAWLKFVETRFGLAPLNARDAAASDMTDFFNFDNPPYATPPQNPPNEPSMQCYPSLP
jgi:phospholipase C